MHRDIKPANLFLARRADGSPLVKVLDFGISKAAPAHGQLDITRTQSVMGSPGYMSPEQLRSSRDVDPRTDIWALGVVLYELVAGRPPFGGESLSEICLKVAMDPTPPLVVPGMPPGFEAIVARCLEKEPAARYPSVAELAAALVPYAPPGAQGAAERVARVLDVPLPASVVPAAAAGPATTLSAASAEVAGLRRRRSRWRLAAALIGLPAAIGVIVALLTAGDPVPELTGAAGGADPTGSETSPERGPSELGVPRSNGLPRTETPEHPVRGDAAIEAASAGAAIDAGVADARPRSVPAPTAGARRAGRASKRAGTSAAGPGAAEEGRRRGDDGPKAEPTHVSPPADEDIYGTRY